MIASLLPLLTQAAAPGIGDKTTWDYIVASGFIGWVICLLSVVAVAMVIEDYLALKRARLAPPELVDELQALLDEGQYQEALELCENEPTFLTRVCAAGILKVGHPFEVIEKALAEMGDEESLRLHQKVGYLSLVASVAPMLGLLGTVQGMIIAFDTIALKSGMIQPGELAGAISIALLTTLFGLLVAIPVTAAYVYLRNHLIRSVLEVGAIVEDLFERFRPRQERSA